MQVTLTQMQLTLEQPQVQLSLQRDSAGKWCHNTDLGSAGEAALPMGKHTRDFRRYMD